MEHGIYSVFDSKAEIYTVPFFAAREEVAIRAIAKAAMNPEHDFHLFGADFTLFQIGTWDAQTAILSPLQAYLNLATALQITSTFKERTA